MFTQLLTTSKTLTPCPRMALKAFALAVGHQVQTAQRLLETRSIHALNPVVAIDDGKTASGHPGLVWRDMN